MATSHQTKTPAGQSPKAHMPLPPLDENNLGDQPQHPRSDVGQYTDKGAPGNQRK